MTASDLVFQGSMPELYDTYLVPMLFEAYANDLAERTAARSPSTVLEMAAGTGVVTRAMASLLGSDTQYTATDLNQSMLDHAASVHGVDDRITWRQSDALNLPFDDNAFDVVVCQYGVMFFPDKVAGYAEALRVLNPDGCLLFNTWGHIRENEFAHVVAETVASIFPDDPPRFLERTPHGYHDVALVRQELNKAGFSQVTIETIEETSAAPEPRYPALAYCHGSPLRNEIEDRDPSLLDYVTDRATEALAERFGDGPITGKIQGHVVAATR
jgi:ubiquinone/menaquinone biosynthesis C-methylase UbiE